MTDKIQHEVGMEIARRVKHEVGTEGCALYRPLYHTILETTCPQVGITIKWRRARFSGLSPCTVQMVTPDQSTR